MSVQHKLCPMCSFECPTIALLLNHLRLVHANDSRFQVCCGINSCFVTCKSFSSLYSHVYRHHPDAAGIRQRTVKSVIAEPTILKAQHLLNEESSFLATGKYYSIIVYLLFCISVISYIYTYPYSYSRS